MNKLKIPAVIQHVVDQDLCIGCGICVSACPNDALKMEISPTGFWTAADAGGCDSDASCLKVCPFAPATEQNQDMYDERVIAETCLPPSKHKNDRIGKYNHLYAGHWKEGRLNSSSGGVATYLTRSLLKQGIVSHVLSVSESKGEQPYQYSLISSEEETRSTQKTKYYPVTMADALKQVEQLNGPIAVVGVACFIKAIRLRQNQDENFKKKVVFTIGIICGGVKSEFFTQYLAGRVGIEAADIVEPEYRIKVLDSDAGDYKFGCKSSNDDKSVKEIRMREVGDMWGSGLFKARACDFCQDVTSELADVSLGDAWIPPYRQEGEGTNIIISRSDLSDRLLNEGKESGELVLDPITMDQVYASQQGSFNHRQDAYQMRGSAEKLFNGRTLNRNIRFHSFSADIMILQLFRAYIRNHSLKLWQKVRNSKEFDRVMGKKLTLLKAINRLVNKRKKITKYLWSKK